ncbi:hypothetical protein CIK05_00235 [Bdellovibrio sp. qaytius]|nr:hypothetical protein CIK05_00235 [Bdellovibrio sp. qaytius]
MKNNILKTIACGALILATVGCKEEQPEVTPIAQPTGRSALMKALETQADGLVASFNNVLVDSKFLKNLDLEHPPEKISMDTEDDVQKAINYLLANEQSQNGATIYTPDGRICSEVLAKNHPETCQEVFSKIKLVQIEQDASSGYVEVYMANIKGFGFYYTPELISAQVDLSGLLAAFNKVDEIIVAHQEDSMELPSMAQGNVSLTVAQKLGATIADLTVNQKIHVQGVNHEMQSYDFAIEAGQNAATLSAFPAMGLASLQVNIPAVAAIFPVHDHDNVNHSVALAFPGGSGLASLNNAMSMVEFSGVKLAAPTVSAKADGQPMAQLTVNGQLDAQVTSYAGGHIGLKFLSAIDGQLTAVSNPLFSEQGTITASIAQGTEAYFAKGADQAKIIAGNFQYVGTQDFLTNINASAGMCIAGEQDQSLILQTVVCK